MAGQGTISYRNDTQKSYTSNITESQADSTWYRWTSSTVTGSTYDLENYCSTSMISYTDSIEYTSQIYSRWISEGTNTASNITPITLQGEPVSRGTSNKPRPHGELRRRLREMADRRANRVIEKRAKELLRFVLTDEEWEDYRQHGSVRITGKHGIYEVGTGWGGQIFMLDHQGKPKEKLCLHAGFEYPSADRIAAVVLEIRADEAGVLAKANRHFFSDFDKRRVKARRGHKRLDHSHQIVGRGVRVEEVA